MSPPFAKPRFSTPDPTLHACCLPIGPQLKDVLKLHYRANRPFLLEGHTGVGKSELVEQVARELAIDCVVLNLSLLEPPDLLGVPFQRDGRTVYAPPSILPTSGKGLLFLEELNRAERYTQNPALLLLTARKLHEYILPAGWVPCAAINPEQGDYLVSALDPAMRSRFAYFRVHADRQAWIDWARSHDIHPAIVQLATEHQRILEDIPPRKWADVSKTLNAATRRELDDRDFLQAALGADLPRPWVLALLHTLDTMQEAPPAKILRILSCYHTAQDLQQDVRGSRAAGATDVLDNITEEVCQLIDGPMLNHLIGNKQFHLDAFDALLADLPGDHRELLQERISNNLAAARLLADRPGELLRTYSNGEMAKKVQLWTASSIQQHRASLLANLVVDFLQRADSNTLQRDVATMKGLGLFVSHLTPSQAEPVLRAIDARTLQPVYPKSYRRAGT